MLQISEQAIRQLKEYGERRGPSAFVRVGILSGSTSGPSLGVTIDDKTDKDELYTFGGLEVVIDSGLLAYCEEISVEYVAQKGSGCGSGGFKITAKRPL